MADPTIWNYLDCDTYIVLSNGSRTAWNPTDKNATGVRSTAMKPLNSGKWYFEFDDIELSGGDAIGLAPGAADHFLLGQLSGSNSGNLMALTLNQEGYTYGSPKLGAPMGHNVGFALDTTSPYGGGIQCWVRYDSTWLLGGGGPEANGPAFSMSPRGMYLYARLQNQWSRATILTGNTRNPPPAGFATWDEPEPIARTHSFIIGA